MLETGVSEHNNSDQHKQSLKCSTLEARLMYMTILDAVHQKIQREKKVEWYGYVNDNCGLPTWYKTQLTYGMLQTVSDFWNKEKLLRVSWTPFTLWPCF